MLSQYDPVTVDYILREEQAPPPFPPATDRGAWNAIKEAIGLEHVGQIVAAAEAAARELVPALPATLFLEFFRSGSRHEYETPWARRREMMADLALAECLEDQGRFLDPLLDVAWAICEESSWEFPAHHRDLPEPGDPTIALFSALTGTQLAELVLLLGERMHPLLEKRIRYEVDRRLLTPYLTRHDFWWLHHVPDNTTCNWTAVCSGNVIASAVYLEKDRARLAEIIARGASSLEDYLETFDSEGGSTEGPAYWGFGFGNYVLAGQLLHQRTNGRIDFFAGDLVRKIALFPLHTMLSPNAFVNFSDCDPEITFPVPLLTFLARHFQVEGLMKQANMQRQVVSHNHNSGLSWALRDLVWRPDPTAGQHVIPARHDWYPDMQWMVARADPADPDALVLAVKGGHNHEMHNQNDVGNLIVHHNEISLVADLGRGRYTRQYFAEGRYEYFVNTSLAHSLPVPNGYAQSVGKAYAARVLEHRADDSCDLLRLDLKGAYPSEADLSELVRTTILHRASERGWVELVDDVTFASREGTFESVLISLGDVKIGSETVQITIDGVSLLIDYDPSVVVARTSIVTNVDLASGPRDVTRVVFGLSVPVKTACVRLCMKPELER